MRITVEVTKKMLKDGTSNAVTCPLALALLKAGCTNVEVGSRDCSLTKDGYNYYGVHSNKIKSFIAKFDDECDVSPDSFRFTLQES